MAAPDSDVPGGNRAMLVVYGDVGGRTYVIAGLESGYALESGSPPGLFNSQFIRRDATFDSAGRAHVEFLNRRAAVEAHVGDAVHVPYPRLNRKDYWESRFRVLGPNARWGFPKGGEKYKDNGDPKTTAIREFREEIGANIPLGNITGYALVRGYHVYFVNVSGPANDLLRNTIDSAYRSHEQYSELFHIHWLIINNERPESYSNDVSRDVANILLRNRGQIGPVPVLGAPAQAQGAAAAAAAAGAGPVQAQGAVPPPAPAPPAPAPVPVPAPPAQPQGAVVAPPAGPAIQLQGAVAAPGIYRPPGARQGPQIARTFATSEAIARAFLQGKIDDPDTPGSKKQKYTTLLIKLNRGLTTFDQIELEGGRRTRRTGRSKPGTKKRRTGGRGRKTRRSP